MSAMKYEMSCYVCYEVYEGYFLLIKRPNYITFSVLYNFFCIEDLQYGMLDNLTVDF
jgi:hypothetical protein